MTVPEKYDIVCFAIDYVESKGELTMKKVFAILLALGLLLSALPALAEDFSGMWYLNLTDVDLGYFQLNEDGTMTGDVIGAGAIEGTWSSTDASVTLVVDGDPLVFFWDGTMLYSADLLIPVIREQGSVPASVIQALENDETPELPEGMTLEQAQAVYEAFEAEFERLQNIAIEAEQQARLAESAEYKVDILAENFYVMEEYSSLRGYWLAKVINMNSVPVYLRDGALKVLDAEGNQVGEATYLSSTGSRYLEPGEISFVSMRTDIEGDGANLTYNASIETTIRSYVTDAALPLADADFEPLDPDSTSYMRTTVTNDTDKPVSVNAVFALEDAEGTPWLISDEEVYNHELTPGSSLILKSSVYTSFAEFIQEKGIEITTIETYAWYEIRDY